MAAFPFIQSKDGKFFITDQAASWLETIEGDVAPICVAGPYRTGKSFLINSLLDNDNGFKVGGTVQACTKGINLWSQPLKDKERRLSYIVMDSEGLGSLERSQTFDTQICSLALVLSSLFILNTQGTINEFALEQMELVVGCTQQLKAHAFVSDLPQDEDNNLSELADYFPSFLWVLRDFSLELTDKRGKDITSQQYLEQCLEPKSVGTTRRGKSKNNVRNALRSVFRDRDCETLVRPVFDEKELQQLGKPGHKIKVRNEFSEQICALRKKVFLKAAAKEINGSRMNGVAFLHFARLCIDAMNQGAVPVISSIWESIVVTQSSNALEASSLHFENEIENWKKKVCVSEEDEMESIFQKAQCGAELLMQKSIVGSASQKKKVLKLLRERLEQSAARHREQNQKLSTHKSAETLDQLWEKGNYEQKKTLVCSEVEWMELMQTINDEYLALGQLGPSKLSAWNTFSTATAVLFRKELFARLKNQTSQYEASIESLVKKKQEIQDEKANVKRLLQDIKERDSKHQQEVKSFDCESQFKQKQLDSLKAERDQLQAKMLRIAQHHEAEVTDLQEKLARSRDDLQKLRTFSKKEVSEAVQRAMILERQIKENAAEAAKKQKLLQGAIDDLEERDRLEKDKLLTTLQDKVTQLAKEAALSIEQLEKDGAEKAAKNEQLTLDIVRLSEDSCAIKHSLAKSNAELEKVSADLRLTRDENSGLESTIKELQQTRADTQCSCCNFVEPPASDRPKKKSSAVYEVPETPFPMKKADAPSLPPRLPLELAFSEPSINTTGDTAKLVLSSASGANADESDRNQIHTPRLASVDAGLSHSSRKYLVLFFFIFFCFICLFHLLYAALRIFTKQKNPFGAVRWVSRYWENDKENVSFSVSPAPLEREDITCTLKTNSSPLAEGESNFSLGMSRSFMSTPETPKLPEERLPFSQLSPPSTLNRSATKRFASPPSVQKIAEEYDSKTKQVENIFTMAQCHSSTELTFALSPEILTASVMLEPEEPTDVSTLIKRQTSLRSKWNHT